MLHIKKGRSYFAYYIFAYFQMSIHSHFAHSKGFAITYSLAVL